MSNCRVIALTNQKGGVGKTTTALNLGIGLANTGKRVLLIDSDPQGSLTAALGWKNSDGLEVTLSSIYGMLLDDKLPKTPSYGILHSQEGVDLLPCDIMLSGTEMALMSSMCRESHLKRYIEFVKDGYDYILIDCLPTLGILVQNALTAATDVLIPTQAQFLSTKGLTQLLHTISQVTESGSDTGRHPVHHGREPCGNQQSTDRDASGAVQRFWRVAYGNPQGSPFSGCISEWRVNFQRGQERQGQPGI